MSRLLKLLGLFFAIGQFAIIEPAWSSQWVYIGDSQSNSRYFLDFDSVKGNDSTRTFWGKAININGVTTSLTKWIVDCKYKQMGVTEAIEYDSSGSVRSHRYLDESVGGMYEFAPGTIAEAYYDYICSRITEQPAPSYSSPSSPSATTAATTGYPKAQCGDPYPSQPSTYDLYPVAADYSPGTLHYIKTNLCQDAFVIKTKDGSRVIQVASFTNINRAVNFANFLKERVGSGEVREPTRIVFP